MNKILISDVDGTLVTFGSNHLSNQLIDKLKSFQDQYYFVIATGRSLEACLNFVDILDMKNKNGYVIAHNGSIIYDCGKDEIIYHAYLDQKILQLIYQLAEKHQVKLLYYQDGRAVMSGYSEEIASDHSLVNTDFIWPSKNNFTQYLKQNTQRIMCSASHQNLKQLYQELIALNLNIELVFTAETYLDIMPKNIDKSIALKYLLEKLNLSKEEAVAVGDGGNDVMMLDSVATGIMVKYGSPSLQMVAKDVCENGDGLIQVIDKYFLGGKDEKVI